MPRSVITHGTNFTEGCSNCPFWADGSDDRGYGCAIPVPIMECPYFRKMCEAEEAKQKTENN